MEKQTVTRDDLLCVTPVFQNKIWGGRKLADEWGYTIPAGPVGECWAISAHPAGDCTVAGGPHDGATLSQLWRQHRELFGDVPDEVSAGQFPLLVKIIDAQDDLSIQVHPDDAYAAAHGGGSLGKKECWYVLDAEKGTTIMVGQRARDRTEFARLVEQGAWDELLNEIPVRAGDFFQIDPGTVHAIKGGTTILETQQSSDVTYRVYDYDRVQDDGTKRPLHLAQSLDVIDYAAAAPVEGTHVEASADGVTRLEANDRYVVDLVCVGDGGVEGREGDGDAAGDAREGAVALPSLSTFRCLSVIAGSGRVAGLEVRRGSHLVELANAGALKLEGAMTLVVSHVPVADPQRRTSQMPDVDELFSGYDGTFAAREDAFVSASGEERLS